MNMSERHKTELKKLVAHEQREVRDQLIDEMKAVREKIKLTPSPATRRLLATTVAQVGKLRRELWRQGFTITWQNEDSSRWWATDVDKDKVKVDIAALPDAIEQRAKARLAPLQQKLDALDTLVASTEKQLVLSGVFDELVTIFKAFEASLAKLSARPARPRKRR